LDICWSSLSLLLLGPLNSRRESSVDTIERISHKADDSRFLKHTYAYMDRDNKISIELADVELGKFEPMERKY